MTRETIAKVESDDYKTSLDVEVALSFLQSLPAEAREVELRPIMGDRGTQRDPEPFLRGLLVRWPS